MHKQYISKILPFITYVIVVLIVLTSNTVLADKEYAMLSPDEGNPDNPMVKKQQEIDKYIFEDYYDEILALGFDVTYTVPMDGYVEIGIIPFSEENANYLYDVFGKEDIKIVKGEKASTMTQIVDSPSDIDTNPPEFTLPIAVYMIPLIILVGIILLIIYKKKMNK